MTDSEYIWAWAIYLSAAGVFYAIFWYFTSKLPLKELRQLLRILLAVLLLVPWVANPDYEFLAPAWIVSISDMLLYGPDAFWRAGLALVLALILAVLISSVVAISLWFRARKRQSAVEEPEDDSETVLSS